MKTPRRPTSVAISKTGVNFVRTIVDDANCIFNEIHQENDIGIDAIVELIKDGIPTGKCIGIQIKSGNSYYLENTNECAISVENHANYWLNYPLPVIGIVYVPAKQCGYWVDIKEALVADEGIDTIKFKCTKVNTLDSRNFNRIFVAKILHDAPSETDFTFEEALELFHSDNFDETNLGMYILFRIYTDRNIVWVEFINYFRQQPANNIPDIFAYYLAHIPWHMDIFGGNDKITNDSRRYAKSLIETFTKEDIVKLLALIREEGINRGTLGQSVEAIISIIPNYSNYLKEIAIDNNIPVQIREWASVIFAYKNQKTVRGLLGSIELLSLLANQSKISALVLTDLRKFHGFILYE